MFNQQAFKARSKFEEHPRTCTFWSHFAVLLKSDLNVQQTHSKAGLLNKSSHLAPALGVTKFTIPTDIILVTLCCAT
jgi:hypothetical protein